MSALTFLIGVIVGAGLVLALMAFSVHRADKAMKGRADEDYL